MQFVATSSFGSKSLNFIDLNGIRQALLRDETAIPNPVGRANSDFVAALRTTGLSWLAIFIDKSKGGMDVIELWKQLFPKRETEIEDAWKKIEPAWKYVRSFRDKAGFHADKSVAFFKARADVIENEQSISRALQAFQGIMRIILTAEPTELPELEAALDELLDELETTSSYRYNRPEFKRYLIIAPSPISNT